MLPPTEAAAPSPPPTVLLPVRRGLSTASKMDALAVAGR
jgi:hypothetical protein